MYGEERIPLMTRSQLDPTAVFRQLLEAAERFEAKAAKHARSETERHALREAITRAQLVLSVSDKKEEPAPPRVPVEHQASFYGPALRSLPGGRGNKPVSRQAKKRSNR